MFLRRLYGGGAAADSAPTRSAWLDSIQLNPAVRGYSAAQSEISVFFLRGLAADLVPALVTMLWMGMFREWT